MPTNAQISRHLKKGLSLRDVVIETLEDARAYILRTGGDPIEHEALEMSRQCSGTLALVAKHWKETRP